jgi:hypothetical protein
MDLKEVLQEENQVETSRKVIGEKIEKEKRPLKHQEKTKDQTIEVELGEDLVVDSKNQT